VSHVAACLSYSPRTNNPLLSISLALTPSPNPHRTTFVSFGSARKSFQREQVSSSTDLPSVILHNQAPKLSSESVLRRSISCSTLDKPLPQEPDVVDERASRSLIEDDTNLDEGMSINSSTLPLTSHFALQAPLQPNPSPEPSIPNDLSTILEVDIFGLSKQAPSTAFSSHSISSARNSLDDNCIFISPNEFLKGAPTEQDD